ncbi:MAG TPA: hypothetical protein VD735_03920 [Candidatus Saccharimonadales bacterium]|nr:hypothetical protein [Candidatus Saccharimonadales bacterium]
MSLPRNTQRRTEAWTPLELAVDAQYDNDGFMEGQSTPQELAEMRAGAAERKRVDAALSLGAFVAGAEVTDHAALHAETGVAVQFEQSAPLEHVGRHRRPDQS